MSTLKHDWFFFCFKCLHLVDLLKLREWYIVNFDNQPWFCNIWLELIVRIYFLLLIIQPIILYQIMVYYQRWLHGFDTYCYPSKYYTSQRCFAYWNTCMHNARYRENPNKLFNFNIFFDIEVEDWVSSVMNLNWQDKFMHQ